MNCANNSDASVKSEKSLCSLNLGVSCGSVSAAQRKYLGVRFREIRKIPSNHPRGATHRLIVYGSRSRNEGN
jgi:hypothetical protein